MSIIKVTPSDFEQVTIRTVPTRTYSSSSAGVTGSVYVFSRRSETQKDMNETNAFIDTTYNAASVNEILKTAQAKAQEIRNGELTGSIHDLLTEYMDAIAQQSLDKNLTKNIEIERFIPSFTLTDNTAKKMVVKDNLMINHRVTMPSANWAYTNYNCLSFFTSSNFPTNAALLYPNTTIRTEEHEGYVSGSYSLSGAFSFDFYINPRYQQSGIDEDFKAGTILHLSSSYALSLISGSTLDENGRAAKFKIQLQLSHSADVSPSLAKRGNYPNDLIFTSDEVLEHNKWHHVVVRWGTQTINDGTGSFVVDNVEAGTFVVPSGTITPKLFINATRDNPDVLVVGNYYEGTNNGTSGQAYFFATDPALRDGLETLINDAGEEPSFYDFTHPLNADLHDVAIKRYYMANDDITASSSMGPFEIDDKFAFYLPPYFVQDSPFRQFVGLHGGILQTPFFEVDGTTDDPFNVAMSFGVGGHYINLENFVRDFANNVFPRLHNLTASAIDYTTDARSANEFLYDSEFVKKRNLLLTPCDDGNFVPNFSLIMSESRTTKFIDDLGVVDYSLINLDNLVLSSSLLFQVFEADGLQATSANEFLNSAVGFTPENPGTQPGPAFVTFMNTVDDLVASGTYDPGVQGGAPLTIYQRTRDPSSNQVTFFDISNLYYGMRILPGSFSVTDTNLSGSGDKLSITLKDDGFGNLYRADCLSKASTWNSVGNIFYDEGVVVIKSPHLFFFGQDQYEMSFQGEQNIHTLKIEVLAKQGQINSSSNPDYKQLHASGLVNDTDPNFVYLTGINFHDKDFNVVAKTKLAQPFMKRFNSRVLVKNTIDF